MNGQEAKSHNLEIKVVLYSRAKSLSLTDFDFRNRIEFCDGSPATGDKVFSRYDERTAVAWLWYWFTQILHSTEH